MSKHRQRGKEEATAVKLSTEDLQNFQHQVTAARVAAATHLMVQESYQRWLTGTLAKYGVSGKASIDFHSGEITIPNG